MTPTAGAFWPAVTPALLLLLGLVVLFILLTRRGARLTEPSCGGCGYPIVGLPTTICPECGRDLMIVGVHWPGESRMRLGYFVVGGWLVLFPVVALPLHHALVSIGPFEIHRVQSMTLAPVSNSFSAVELSFEHEGIVLEFPRNQGVDEVIWHGHAHRTPESAPTPFDFAAFNPGAPLRAIRVLKFGLAPRDVLQIKPDLSGYSVLRGDEVLAEVEGPLGATTLAQWLSIELPAHRELQADADEILHLIKSYQSGTSMITARFGNPIGLGYSGKSEKARGFLWLLRAMWLTLYIGGAILIRRRFASGTDRDRRSVQNGFYL